MACLSLKRKWLNDGERNHHDEKPEEWMRFVIDTRSGSGGDISRVIQQIGIGGVVETVEQSEVKYAGLNMLEELAWINSFLDKGTYAVNWGPVK